MENKEVNRVDLIFETCEAKEILKTAMGLSNEAIIDAVIESGLRGRGGAGFPTGMKWKFTAATPGDEKYVICNADEGEPGTFKDREILTQVPEKIFVGMAIAGKVIKAKEGFIYLRGEYQYLRNELDAKLAEFNKEIAKYIDFEISFRMGSGAYVCGEETALFESMEGKRGEPRNKPPYPTISGFRSKPTIINNVETLSFITMIIKHGAENFKSLGTMDSRGSKVFSISGDLPNPGIYELELGMTLQYFVNEFSDNDAKAVQVGGASGFCVPRKKFGSTIIGFEGVPTGGSMKVFNSSRSMYNVLHNYLEFFEEESCGQCTPCRVGTQQLKEGIEQVKRGEKSASYLDTLMKLAETMKLTAKCGLGQSVANSFASIVTNFREEMIY